MTARRLSVAVHDPQAASLALRRRAIACGAE